MKRNVINFDKNALFEESRVEFLRLGKFNPKNRKHRIMYDNALKHYETISDRITPNAILVKCDPEVYHNGRITLDKEDFCCSVFEKIPDDAVKHVYIFLATAGKVYSDDDKKIQEIIFSDLWGNAYINVVEKHVRNLISDEIKKENEFISMCFGPGYFGMPLTDNISLFDYLQGNGIGMDIWKTGVLVPAKSCSGIFLGMSTDCIKMPAECDNCIGNKIGCQFCRIRMEKENK